MDEWEAKFAARLETVAGQDAAHDVGHVRRVRGNAVLLSAGTEAKLEVVLPAVWLHDGVAVAKDSPERGRASRLAGAWARGVMKEIGYPAEYHDAVVHAIEAHSFSAGIPPETLEAKIVQDADRLDALGAIGIARCFAVGGALGRALYAADDPFCETREPDDGTYTLDHFYAKLFTLPATMQTAAGRAEAERRVEVMRGFVADFGREIANG